MIEPMNPLLSVEESRQSMNKASWLAVALVVAATGTLSWWWLGQPATSISPAPDRIGETGPVATPTGTPLPADPPFRTGLENLPASLRDVEVDGGLMADAQGHLILDNNVRRLFDFFLTATGAEAPGTPESRIRAYIDTHLQGPAAAEAHRVLNDYLAMQQALKALPSQTPAASNGDQLDPAALRARKAEIQAIRQQHLGPEAYNAFFEQDDVYDNFSLSRLEIAQDQSLSPLERSERIAALEQTLPDELRESVQSLSRLQSLNSLTRDWQTSGGSDAELRQIRENLVGAEAADRLEALDNQSSNWNARINTWLEERDAVLTNDALSEQDRTEQLDALRQTHFTAGELNRVQALERIRDGNVR